MSKAKVVISFALQENFGFSILEACYLGCIPIVPNRLVYPELYGEKYLYDTFEDACNMVENAIYNGVEAPYVRDFQECMEKWFEN